jgi:hypothetical protein
MEISNFSSLIEVGVALNIACVAIEYVKSYNDVLCNQVFNLEHKIETAVKECRSKLNEVMDVTTLTNLPNTVIGGRNTEVLKQRLLRSRETLTQDIIPPYKHLLLHHRDHLSSYRKSEFFEKSKQYWLLNAKRLAIL